jgi:hypothetical protein
MSEVEDNFIGFINSLDARTIYPIDNRSIKESCTATLLLLFAAVDSLSKITCTDNVYAKYKNNEYVNKIMFTGFLQNEMGGKYAAYKCKIYKLRNDIVHTGLNTKTKLFKSTDQGMHLTLDKEGYLLINTNQFLDDVKKAIENITNKYLDVKGNYYSKDWIGKMNKIEIDDFDSPSPSKGPGGPPY